MTLSNTIQKLSLFDKLGGSQAISLVVDKFYDLMLADQKVNFFFKNTEMEKQRKIQKQFVTMAFGGPNNYEGQGMTRAHQKFFINQKQFDATWDNLQKSMKFYKINEQLIKEAKIVFYSVAKQVVNAL